MAHELELKTVVVPEIGFPGEPRPELGAAVFEARLGRVRAHMRKRGLEALVVYGDREHVGNIQWLTNYDPRFEETLLVVRPAGRPVLFVGNEGMGYSTVARLDVERRLCQTLSLLGQPRERVRPLAEQLREAGVREGAHTGTAGWKYFSPAEFDEAESVLDLPDYLAAALRRAAGAGGRVTNETALFMNPEDGLRVLHEAEQLADFEWIATANSQALLEGIRAVRPGMTEHDGYRGMRSIGLAYGCHPLCTTGERARVHGMASPTSHRIQPGDPVMMTMSYQGANTCRFGWMAAAAAELPDGLRDYVEKTALPYGQALFAWYETLRLGCTGGDLHQAVHGIVDPAGLTVSLNAGHLTAMDEWTHSPVTAESGSKVRSGMYWQADFFGTVPSLHHGAFAEDGLAVADEALRDDLQSRFPAMAKRVAARRAFMEGQLGLTLAPEILPFSNFPAMLVPFFLAPSLTLVIRREGRPA